MLYHVSDLSRGLEEIVRVLRPRGTLVAVTNSKRQLREMWDVVGVDRDRSGGEDGFNAENGQELLAAHFREVERIDENERFHISEAVIRDYIRRPASPNSPTTSHSFPTGSPSPPPAASSSPPPETRDAATRSGPDAVRSPASLTARTTTR